MNTNKIVYGLFAGMVVLLALAGITAWAALRPAAMPEEVQPTEVAAEAATVSPLEPTTAPTTATPQPTEVPCAYDLYIIDGPSEGFKFGPGEEFQVAWTLKNTGTCAWPTGTALRFAGDEQMGGPPSVEIPGETAVDSEFEFTLELTAPTEPGMHQSTWQLVAPDGEEIGGLIYFSIEIPEPPTPTPAPTATAVPPTATPKPTQTPTPTAVPDAAAEEPTATPERKGPSGATDDSGFMDVTGNGPRWGLLLLTALFAASGLGCGVVALFLVFKKKAEELDAIAVSPDHASFGTPVRACSKCGVRNSPRRAGVNQAACRNCGEMIDFTAPRAEPPPPSPEPEPPSPEPEKALPRARLEHELAPDSPDLERGKGCPQCGTTNYPLSKDEAHQALCRDCDTVLEFPAAAPAEEEEAPPEEPTEALAEREAAEEDWLPSLEREAPDWLAKLKLPPEAIGAPPAEEETATEEAKKEPEAICKCGAVKRSETDPTRCAKGHRLPKELWPPEPDDLTQIAGIGPSSAEILNGAGITTFAQLATANTRTLKTRFKDARRNRIERWQAEARRILASTQAAEGPFEAEPEL
jgi:predicted flap endonuclease-1-like 5' DNA nuclease